MSTTTFPERIQYAIKCAGGNQSELARRVSVITGRIYTAQAIQKLADKNAKKPATSSGLTVAIAIAADLNPKWLALGVGEPHSPPANLIERTVNKIESGTVPKELQESLYSLMRAIAGPDATPHAAENTIPYEVRVAQTKKKATA